MTKIIVVLAGNDREAREYISRQKPDQEVRYIYVTRPEHVFGVRVSSIVVCGTYWMRKDVNPFKLEQCVMDRVI